MSYEELDTTDKLADLMQTIEEQVAYQPLLRPVLRHLKRAYEASVENDRDPQQPN